MHRRGFLAACGSVSIGGCLGVFASEDDRPSPGDVTCAEGLPSGSSNGPADGSWPTVLHDMRNTGQTDAPGPSGCVETQWTWSQNPQAGLFAGPVIADGFAYVPHPVINETRFVVLDAKTGAEHWRYTNPERQFLPNNTPTLVGRTLHLSSGHALEVVDLQDRITRWHLNLHDQLETEGLTSPRVANGLLYVGTAAGTILAFDADTGTLRWTYDTEGAQKASIPNQGSDAIARARLEGAVYDPVAVTDQRVFVSSWDFTLYALDAKTGEPLWTFSPGIGHLYSMRASVVADGTVYAQTKDARLFVLDAETGTKQWVFDEIGQATDGISPVVDENSVYVVAGTSTENLFLVALDRDGGTVRWKRSIGPTMRSPVADADTLYLDQGPSLQAIGKEGGKVKWELQLQRGLAAPPAIVDSALYAADAVGTTYGVW